MGTRKFEQCISKIIADIEKRNVPIDYADKNAVRRYNSASDRIYANFAYIDEHFPERINELMQYVDSANTASVWYFVFGISQMKHATKEQKIYCIDELRKLYMNPNITELDRFTITNNIEELESKL